MDSITRLYKKQYTMKEWDRFDWVKQEILCRKYNVIITDWIPKKQRMINKIDRILDGTIIVIDKVSNGLKKLDGSKIKMFEGTSQKSYNSLVGMPKKDYSSVIGKNSKRDYSALIGKR
jgi:hypothetical protein